MRRFGSTWQRSRQVESLRFGEGQLFLFINFDLNPSPQLNNLPLAHYVSRECIISGLLSGTQNHCEIHGIEYVRIDET